MKDFIFSATITSATATNVNNGLHVRCGFVPKHVIIRSRTSGNSIEWFASMPDASKYTSDDTGSNTGFAYAASAGITPIDGLEATDDDYYIDDNGSETISQGKVKKQGFFVAGGCFVNAEVCDIFAER